MQARLQTLPPQLRALIERAGDALVADDIDTAQRVLATALAQAPAQPDVLRLYGLLLARIGNPRAAAMNLEAALRAAPDDAMGYWQFAQVCDDAGDAAGGRRLREQAVRELPRSPLAWADLGAHLLRDGEIDAALAALERSTRLEPGYAPAQLDLGDALVVQGRIDDGAAAMRRAIAARPEFGDAWLSLVDVKTVAIRDEELDSMEALVRGRAVADRERTAIMFALGKVYEDRGRYADAFSTLIDANLRRKQEVPAWDEEAFLLRNRLAEAVFAGPHAVAADPTLGGDVIFVAGLPRSGTTLVEQILASHPRVHGAGELAALAQVLTEESARLRQRYPEWVPAARPDDWQRLGRRYLELTAPLRPGGVRSTDKLPNNWQALGAIRAMLPGARAVLCRRDPLENCWSCFRQYFAKGWEVTCDLQHLGTFWRAFDSAASTWAARDPRFVREQSYEGLTACPEREIRALLEFCGLPFEPACMRPHDTSRSVRTLSAAQVRRPLGRKTQVAAAYGALLDPLRHALGVAKPGTPPADHCRT